MKKTFIFLLALLFSASMFAQDLVATRQAKLVTANRTTQSGNRLLGNQANPPTSLTGYAAGNQGTFSWTPPTYQAGYTNELASSTGGSISGTGTHYVGIKIPASVMANYVGWEFIDFAFALGANGNNVTGFYYFNGTTLQGTGTALSGLTASSFPSYNWTNPISMDPFTDADLLIVVAGTGAAAGRTFLRYDTQGTGQAGYTAIRMTNSVLYDVSTTQTHCIFSTIRDPNGATYKLYGDGTLVADNITATTYTIPTLPSARPYTVTTTHASLTESGPSNAVVLGPSTLPAPTNLTGVWNGSPTFSVDLSWDYPVSPTVNTVLLNETFTTTPFTRGWQSLQGPSAAAVCKWAWNTITLPYLPNPPCVSSASYVNGSGNQTPDNWLVTPAITGLNGITKLSWRVEPYDADYPAEKYSVYISTTGNQIADFTTPAKFTETCTGSMLGGVVRTIDISEYAGQTIYIAFRHYDCTGMYWLNMDDIKVVTNYDPIAPPVGGFIVYQNNEPIATINNPAIRTFNCKIITEGVHTFKVTALADDQTNESLPSNNWSTINIQLPTGPCLPPFDVAAVQPTISNVNLTWKDPRELTFEKHAMTASTPALGGFTNASYTFLKGIGFTPAQMSQWGYEYFSLKAVKVSASAAMVQNNANRVKLYTGVNATGYPNTIVLDEAVTTGFTAGWNTITLANPYLVDISQNFYVIFTGYNVSTTAYHHIYEPNSPYVDKLTNLFAFASGASLTLAPTTTLYASQTTAASMAMIAVFGYKDLSGKNREMEASYEDGQWRIISDIEEATPIVQYSYKDTHNNESETPIFTPSPVMSPSPDRTMDPRNTGFFVYRDGVKLNATQTVNYTYSDIPPASGIYKYVISAVYTDLCGEIKADPITVEFGNIVVKNLTATLNGKIITLNWDPCEAPLFMHYNVYVGGALVGTVSNVATPTFQYVGDAGTYNFQVSATYNFSTGVSETSKASVSIFLPDTKPGVENVKAEIVTGNAMQALLTWDVPTKSDFAPYMKSNASAVLSNSIGFATSTGTLRTGHYYTAAQIGTANAYNKCRSISVYIAGDDVTVQGTAEVYLATANTTASIIAGSRVAFTPVLDAWNTIEIPSTVTLNPANALYVGYILTNWNGYPAAYDNTTLAGATNGLFVNSGTGNLATGTYGCWMIKMELYRDNGTPRTDIVGYNVLKAGDPATLAFVTTPEYLVTENTTREYWVSAKYATEDSKWKKCTANFYPITANVTSDVTVTLACGVQNISLGNSVFTGNVITVSATTTTPGYHVNTLKANGVIINNGGTFTLTANTVITDATYEPNTYTLSFSTSPSTEVIASQTVTFDAAIGTLPVAADIPGWTFMGWYIGATPITATTLYTWASNQTATAKWNPTYTLTFDPYGGAVSPLTKTVTYELPVGELPIPTLLGNTFLGWKIVTTPIDETTVWTYTSNQTATATWTPTIYTLTLDAAPGTVATSSIPVTYGSLIGSQLVNPTTPTNCVFLGWFVGTTQISQSTTWNIAADTIAKAAYTYGVTVQSTGPGTYTPMGVAPTPNTIQYAKDATPTYTFTPNADSYIVSVFVDGVSKFTGNSELYETFPYTFSAINAAHTIQVTFAKRQYAANPSNSAGTGATIVMSPNPVQHGSNVTFTFVADCVDITGITIDGVPYGPPYTPYTINATGPLPVIVVTTQQPNYTMTATPAQDVDPMGYITPAGINVPVDCGETITYHFVTELGYRVKTLTVDGSNITPIPASKSYTFADIHASHVINLEFEEFPYYVISFGPSAGQNLGGVVYSNLFPNALYYVAVDSGTLEYSFTIVADQGYEIDKVFVDNTSNIEAANTGKYTFKNILTDHTIFATFKPKQFTITATADANGSIVPGGAVKVNYGKNQTFNTAPNTGYQLDKILIDGVENPTASADGFYTFENVLKDYTISATFTKKSYTITTTAGSNGTISPVNPTVLHGNNQTINFTPIAGYVVDQVLVDDVEMGPVNSYTFVNVTQNHKIHVTFAKAKFTITATSTGGGDNSYITPSGVATVEYDAHSKVYVFVAESGYHVQNVIIDGVNSPLVVEDGMYRFMNVKANHTIHVIFATDNLTIMATANQGGSINPAGVVNVAYGASKTFYFQANQGYDLVRVLINGINDDDAVAAGKYTFEGISTNNIISAQFEKKMFDVTYEEALGAVIDPGTSVSPVAYNGQYKFSVKLQEGYTQSNIIVRANNLAITPAGALYTINNITKDQHITIDGIALNQYKIIAKAYAGGTITPAGTFMVEHGSSMTFEMTPGANYKVSDVLVNGESEGEITTYLFSDVRADGKIEAYFKNTVGIDANNEATINVFSQRNIVTVMNENLVPVKQVEIMDMYGRLVWSGQALTEKTEITLNVAAGIYTVRIITESNTNTTTKVSITK